MALLATSTQQ